MNPLQNNPPAQSLDKEKRSRANNLPLEPLERGRNMFHDLLAFYTWCENTWSKTEWKQQHAGNGESLWDVEMVSKMNTACKAINSSTKKGGKQQKYEVVTFEGAVIKFYTPIYDPKTQLLSITPIGPLEMSQNISVEGELISKRTPHIKSFSVSLRGVPRHITNSECRVLKGDEPWKEWVTRWRTGEWSEYRNRVQRLIHKQKDQLKGIDQIICFALGSLMTYTTKGNGKERDKEFPAPFLQHMVASTVRETIYELRHSKKAFKNIPILAQDPAYCENCSEVLKQHLDIDTTTDFTGMIAVANAKKKTFVISINATNDLVSMVCDVTNSFGGPQAMLCDGIDLHERSWNGKDIKAMPWLHWNEWDGDKAMTKNFPYSDQTTKNMAAYALNCHSYYFGDFREKVGMPQNEYIPDDYPSAAGIKRKRQEAVQQRYPNKKPAELPKEEACNKIYKEVFGTDYNADYNEALEIVRKVNSSFFGDLRLYVKKAPEKK